MAPPVGASIFSAVNDQMSLKAVADRWRRSNAEASKLVAPPAWAKEKERQLLEAANTVNTAGTLAQLSKSSQLESQRKRAESVQVATQELHRKLRDTRGLAESLMERRASLAERIDSTAASQVELRAAKKALELPSRVVSWRLRERARRPEGERTRDEAEVCLEEERDGVNEEMRSLTDAEARSQRLLQALEQVHEEVTQDLRAKQHALKIDRTLRTSLPPDGDASVAPRYQGIPMPPPPPGPAGRGGSLSARGSLTPPPGVVPGRTPRGSGWQDPTGSTPLENSRPGTSGTLPTGAAGEAGWRNRTQDLMKRAMHLEATAAAQVMENSRLITQVRKQSERQQQRSEQALNARIAELRRAIEEVEAKLAQLNRGISKSQITNYHTGKELEAQVQPRNRTQRWDALRHERPARERIEDGVQATGIRAQLDTLNGNARSLGEQRVKEVAALSELQTRKQELTRTLEAKKTAYKIDSDCIRPLSTFEQKTGVSAPVGKPHHLNGRPGGPIGRGSRQGLDRRA